MKNRFCTKQIAALILMMFAVSLAASAQTVRSTPLRQEKLLNGLKIYMQTDPQATDVRVKIRVHSGSAFDPQGKEGTIQMLADNIFPNEAAKEFFSDDLGGSLQVATTYDYIQINASAKPEEFLTMIETLANAVSKPIIDKETTAKLRIVQLEKARELEKNPARVADQAVAQRLFGSFPYGRPQTGTTESIQKIDFADLIFAKDRFFSADNATMTITGNFQPDLAVRAARRYFGAWAKSDGKIPATFRQPEPPKSGLPIFDAPVANKSEFRLAVRGVARNDADYYAAQILGKILQARWQMREGSDGFVRSEAHVLPGAFVFGASNWHLGTIRKSGNTISLPQTDDYHNYFLKEPVKNEEFVRAKSDYLAELSKTDASEFYLDADTYKLSTGKTAMDAAQNVTIEAVQKVLSRLQKEPAAMVLVFSNPEAEKTN